VGELVHKVRLEPNIRNFDYTVARYGLWRKLSKKTSKRGVELLSPLTLTATRYLYQITKAVNDLRILSMSVKTLKETANAVRQFHSLRTFFESRRECSSSDCVAQGLKVIAMNLRFAKVTQRVQDMRVRPARETGSRVTPSRRTAHILWDWD